MIRRLLLVFVLTRGIAIGATHLGAALMTPEKAAQWRWIPDRDNLFPGPPPSAPLFPPSGPGVPPVTLVPPSTPETPVPPSVPETPPPITIVLPEPATWAMMILGLFAIGLRRRVRK